MLWQPPPPDLTLSEHEVHVWKASLNDTALDLQRLSAFLSADEREKAARFCFDKDRHQYWAARGLLRLILGGYLCQKPEALRFIYNPYGKPALDARYHRELPFNLSHSNGLALFAVAQRYRVGVDLEYRRADFGWQQIVAQYFSAREVQALAKLPQHQQFRAFFEGWTRKEAYIKAKGLGFSISFQQFAVSLTPDQPAALLQTQDPQEAQRWTMQALEVGEDYAGAIAIEGRNPILKYWQISPGWGLDNT